MAGYSRLDDEVLSGKRSGGKWGVGSLGVAYSNGGYTAPLDDQVLGGSARMGVPGLGSARRRRGVRGLGQDGSDPADTVVTLPGALPGYTNPPLIPINPVSSPASINWGEFNTVLGTGLNFATRVLQLQPGVTTYTTPQGAFTSVAAAGQLTPGLPLGLPGFFATSGSSLLPWLLIGGVGLFVIMAIAKS